MRPSRETHERRAECEQRQYNCTLEKGREMRTMRPPTPVDCNGQEFHPVNQNNMPQYMNLKTKIQEWDDLRQAYTNISNNIRAQNLWVIMEEKLVKLLLLVNLRTQFNFRSVQTKFGLIIELVMISELRLVILQRNHIDDKYYTNLYF